MIALQALLHRAGVVANDETLRWCIPRGTGTLRPWCRIWADWRFDCSFHQVSGRSDELG